MNKIGIKIIKISGGVQDLETFNGGDWTRKVSDIRTDFKSVSGNALEEGKPVLMVSFVQEGGLVTVSHVIPGRIGDLVSAWIFFPTEMDISAEEELAVIERVKEEIAKPTVENWDAIGQLCAKEYPLKQGYFNYKESAAVSPCAVRYYGTGTDFGLRELLGDGLYQDYYTGHRFVFFLDTDSGIVADEKLKNYTNEPVRQFVFLTPPQMPENVIAKLNDKDFSKPIFGVKGEKATLTFYRQGYSPIAFQIVQGGQMPDLSQLSWQRLITPSFFYVTDNENRDLNVSSRIRINGQWLSAAGISMPEGENKNMQVEVMCPGYEPCSATVSLLQQPPIRLLLEREKANIVYIVDGKECPNLTECPQGYEYTETRQGKKIIRNCYYKQPETGPNWKLIAIIESIAALIVGLALGILLHKTISNRHSDPTETKVDPNQTGRNPNDTITAGHRDNGKVYKCLNQKTWKRKEIDENQELQGFFDDLGELKVDTLTEKWAKIINPDLHPQWKSVLDTLLKHKENLSPGTILNKSQSAIDVDSYIRYVKKRIKTPKNESATQIPATKTIVAGKKEVSLENTVERSPEKK